jgi:PKD repeat protein
MQKHTFLSVSIYSALLLIIIASLLQGCHPDEDAVPRGQPTAQFSYNLSGNCPTPCQVCFTNTSQSADSYSWDFGNGQTSTETSPCVSFTPGTYNVTLTASSGTQSSITSQTLTIQDNMERYRRTFSANFGIINHLLDHNGSTYALMTIDGVQKMFQFNSNGEATVDFPGTISVNDMVADPDGGILCTGNFGLQPTSIGLAKLTSSMSLNFEQIYNLGAECTGASVVVKNTSPFPGYIITGRKDNGSQNQALLINTVENGEFYFQELVDYSYSGRRIFRNGDNGSYAYVSLGTWYDPLTGKKDIQITTINENGVDYLAAQLYPGIGNNSDDELADAIQFGNGSSYAGIGYIDGSPTFFTVDYSSQDKAFNALKYVTGFGNAYIQLKGVCKLANNQGFGFCGTINTGTNFGDVAIFVAKIDNSGQIVWKKTWNRRSAAGDIIATPDGGMLVGGQEFANDLTSNFPVLYKLDLNGNFE